MQEAPHPKTMKPYHQNNKYNKKNLKKKNFLFFFIKKKIKYFF